MVVFSFYLRILLNVLKIMDTHEIYTIRLVNETRATI